MPSIVDAIDRLYKEKTPQEVERFMLEARDRNLTGPTADLPELITVCNELGAYYRERSRWASSIHNFEIALEKSAELLGTKVSEQYAVVLLNIAGTYCRMKDFEKAMECYRQAFDILTSLGKGSSYEFASLLNNMSIAFEEMGDYPSALDHASGAYEIISELSPGTQQEAVSLVNLASLAVRAGDIDKAANFTGKAVDIYDSLGVTGGHYPAAVNLSAVLAFKRGRYEEALAGFERSAELTKATFGENKDYASALVNVAAVLSKLGRDKEAQLMVHRAETIREGFK